MNTQEIETYWQAFAARIEASGECAHGTFPEVADDATHQIIEQVLFDLGSLIAAGAGLEEVEPAAMHAFVMVAAWGYGLGALSMSDMTLIDVTTTDDQPATTDDPDPAVADWQETLRIAPESDWF